VNETTVRSGPRAPRLPLTDDRAWDARDVAYFLGVSYSTVRNLVNAGALPALPRIGTRLTFDPKQVRALRERGWSGGRKAS
jgi:predicted DNA-binding transcriptional regulator AlpA